MGATTLSAVGATVSSRIRGEYGKVGSGIGVTGYNSHGDRYVIVQVAPSSSYATGGDSISLASLGLSEVRQAWIEATQSASANGGVSCEVVVTDPKAPLLKLYTAAATEAGAASDNSTRSWTIRFVGR